MWHGLNIQLLKNKTASYAEFALLLLLFQNPFTKDCGSDDVCVSDLVLSVKTDTKASR